MGVEPGPLEGYGGIMKKVLVTGNLGYIGTVLTSSSLMWGMMW